MLNTIIILQIIVILLLMYNIVVTRIAARNGITIYKLLEKIIKLSKK